MTSIQIELWNRIHLFEIDDINSSFTFTDRLARENNWTLEYSLRVILEYKKFIFLLLTSNGSLTPSNQVDQVWHLHLLYTRSYWIDFCENTIHKTIHHNPTKGKGEQSRFIDQYKNTLDRYRLFFNAPPNDIWMDKENRFKGLIFVRVNKMENWIIPKIRLK